MRKKTPVLKAPRKPRAPKAKRVLKPKTLSTGYEIRYNDGVWVRPLATTRLAEAKQLLKVVRRDYPDAVLVKLESTQLAV